MTETKRSAFTQLKTGEWKRLSACWKGQLDRGECGGRGNCMFECIATALNSLFVAKETRKLKQEHVRAAAAQGIMYMASTRPRLGRDFLCALSEFKLLKAEPLEDEAHILGAVVKQLCTPGFYGTQIVLQALSSLSTASAEEHARSGLVNAWIALAPSPLVFLVLVVDRHPGSGRIRYGQQFISSMEAPPGSEPIYVLLLNDRTAPHEELAHYQLLRSRKHQGAVLLTRKQVGELGLSIL